MVDIEGGEPEKWKVENYEQAERGPISLKQGLWQSDNTVFTDLVMNADGRGLDEGPSQVVDVAERLGIRADFADPPHPSVVLGTQEVSPMDMAVAYATIANEGEKVEPRSIMKVIRNDGEEDEKVLFTAAETIEGEQVIEPEIAAQATELMMGDIINGIAGEAALENRPVAGKTGTSERFFDAWFVGFTPQLTTGVWMGYAEGGKTLQSRLGPEARAAGYDYPSATDIFHAYMTEVMEGRPAEEFENVDPPKPVAPPALHADAVDPAAVDPVTGAPVTTTTAAADPTAYVQP
jgi:penicillin-binding protein 1A